jgi:hypothetical protein
MHINSRMLHLSGVLDIFRERYARYLEENEH